MDQLAICAIFRNEAPYIHEWLSYHYAQGVRRFVLYDNASTDETRAIIEAWPRRDLVTVIDWPDQESRQLRAYADMVVRCRGAVEWCAFIDCDEFLTPQSHLSLPDVLRAVGPQVNGMYVHWLMFGSSGHDARQPGLVTETFRWRAPDAFGSHHYGKSIMRIAEVTHVGIHVFRCRGLMVNDSGTAIDQQSAGFQEQRSHALLALNHYFTKSREEWRARRGRGRADKEPADPDYLRPDSEFAQHDINAVRDDRAGLFMQAARALFYLPLSQPPGPLAQPAHLVTAHGTLLCWDNAASRPLHCAVERLSERFVPIRCVPDGDDPSRCRLYRNGEDSPAPIDGHAIFAAEPAGPGACLHLRGGGSFLCAEGSSSEVHTDRSQAREWETFLALPEEAVAHLQAASPGAARLLPGFQLALGEDRYDLQWSVPMARLARVASSTPAPATHPATRSLTFYDLAAEDDAAPPPVAPRVSTTTTPPVGPGLLHLLEAGRIGIVHRFAAAAGHVRTPPFLAMPVGNPKAPYAALFSDPGYRTYTAPETACFTLRDACILGSDAMLWLAGGLVPDSVHSLEPWRAETLAAEAPADGATQLRLKRDVPIPPARAGRFLCGFVGAWRNYAHWMTECLPRLFMFQALQRQNPDLHLVLPRLGTGRAQEQTLALLGIGPERVVWLGDGEALAGDIWTTTSIDPWAVPDMCREAARALASRCPDAPGAERIYIRRGTDTRRMLSLPLLLPVLQEHGFRIVTMQDLTVADQIRTMRAARVVIGENGAAVANIMFCRPGARVLELFNEAWANPAHWTLASLCGLEYGYIEGRHVPSALAPMPSHNADYVITPEQLDAGLRALLVP